MIFAVVMFITTQGPVNALSARQWFRSVDDCETFLAVNEHANDRRRLELEQRERRPVAVLAFCVDMGAVM